MIVRLNRPFSTRSIVDQWFRTLQLSTHDEQQTRFAHCIEQTLQLDPTSSSNLIKDVIHRWAVEYPTRAALYICDRNKDECQILTFRDIYIQASRLAAIMSRKELNLTSANNVCTVQI
jgi:hypothetical protein